MIGGDIGYTNSKGKVFASRDILYSVVALAVKEVKGVAALMTPRKAVARKANDGVKVNFLPDGNLDIAIYIKTYYTVNVPELSSRVQESVRNGIASMLEVEVKNIDVNVVGVEFIKPATVAVAVAKA